MDLPDHDNVQKWWKTVANGLRKNRTRAVVVFSFVALVTAAIGYHFWRLKVVNQEKSELQKQLGSAEKEIGSLRFTNQNLVSENNRFKIVFEPVQKLYPQLELAAA